MARSAITYRVGRVGLALLLFLAGCTPLELKPLPLEVTIETETTTAAVGTEVVFQVSAQGGSLLGVRVEYGDGESAAVAMYGARTGRSQVRHAYAQAGTYTVAARVEDAVAGEKTASLIVTIE